MNSLNQQTSSLLTAAIEELPVLRIMGISVFDPKWARRRHRDSHVELLCVVRGRLTVAIEDRKIRMKAGDFFLIPANTPHYDLFEAGHSPEVFMAQFSWRAQNEFFEKLKNRPLSALANPVRNEILRIILQLREHRTAALELPEQTLSRSLLHTLLLMIWRGCDAASPLPCGNSPGGGKNRQRELMERTRQYLETHYHEQQSLQKIARRLQLSPCYVSRVFSHESGFSLISYLTSVRLFRARELLRAGQGNVSQVAQAVGYESSAHFSRMFKRQFGIAPSEINRETMLVRR